ncbi:MAG: hypothetical protein BWY76_00454 [bacterium ADurb.Bin429]|nr:MAG: hypothetical protein BWY76_00454 [bacterium ADurb.Bin429]
MTVPHALATGETITVSLRARVDPVRLLNKFCVLYRPTPQALPPTWTEANADQLLAACTMHVLGGALHHLRAYVPSQAMSRETVEILVRPEDAHSNLCPAYLSELAVTLNGTPLPAEAVPVPDSTCVRLRVTLFTPGTHRLTVREARSGLETTTNPIVVRETPLDLQVYWGMIHGHSEMSDGCGDLEYYFRQIRDEAALDFAAPGDHDHLYETSDAFWTHTRDTVKQWHAPGTFVTFLGYEFAKWRRLGEGDRNVYYLHDDRPMYRSDEGHYPMPSDLFRALAEETALIIPHHTGHDPSHCDWVDHDPVRERLVEIYQCRGSYECAEEDGNTVPDRRSTPNPVGYVQRALALGWRVGFTAGGDDHQGHAGTDFPLGDGAAAYQAGLFCVLATARTREAIWEALWERRTVATTGPRILLAYTLNGHLLGTELSAAAEPSLATRRTLAITYAGTAPVERVEILRNNMVIYSVSGAGRDGTVAWEDTAALDTVLLPPAPHAPEPFCCYYVRLRQQDGAVAWASPVWITP